MTFEVLFFTGVALLLIKLGVLLLNKTTALDITLYGGKWFWNFAPLLLMVVAGIGSGILKDRYKPNG